MKTILSKYSLLILTLLFSSGGVDAQYTTATADIAGLDLNRVKRSYERALKRGDSSITVKYAELLYIKGEFDRAFDMYEKADRLGLITNKYQKRDYVHAGRRTGREAPYVQDTGYFDRTMNFAVDISPFCNNSAAEDFAPFYWKELLFVTSSRSSSGREYEFTQNPFLNVHTFLHDCISANIPDALPEGINTENHDGPLAISADGNLLIITRNHTSLSSGKVYNLYLDYYHREGNKWSESKHFPLFDKEYSVQHPFYCDKEGVLYFSSNAEGGNGGFDIYRSKWNGSGWEDPENLGPEINSPYDEVFPALTPDGSLIYATNHIETTGGLDLVMFRDGIRYLLPGPFNTVHDDFSITFRNETSGYFASGRDAEAFADNIYVFRLEAPLGPKYDFYVEVLDRELETPLEDVLVSFAAEPAEGEALSSEKGLVFLHRGSSKPYDYKLRLTKDGYQTREVVSGEFIEREGEYFLTLNMEKTVDHFEEEMLTRGYFEVYFDNDRPDPNSTSPTTSLSYQQTFYAYMLRKDDYYSNSISSREELDEFFQDVEKGMEQLQWLVRHMQDEMDKSKSYTILFTSHASPLAGREYNLMLSQRRFASVENFIKNWDNGSLQRFINEGKLSYENNPVGDMQARPDLSADRDDPARSIYSVEAARERKVTISWYRNDNERTGENLFRIPERTERFSDIDTGQQQLQHGYHIIAGSYTDLNDAKKEKNRLINLYQTQAVVLPKTPEGFYRVSYSVYPSLQEASTALGSIRANIRTDAWILSE